MSWIPIIVAALVPMAVGMAWYHEKLFGKAWRETLGLSQEDLKTGNMAVIFGLSIVMAILISMFLSHDVNHDIAGFATFKHGAFHAFLGALMFAVPVLVSNSLFQRNSLKNIAINAGYWILTITLMGGILNAWQMG